jgi:hypothetical protein
MDSMQFTPEPREDEFTKTVEKYTASIPSSAYLGVAVTAMAVSLVLSDARPRQMGKLHCSMGSDVADHRTLQ